MAVNSTPPSAAGDLHPFHCPLMVAPVVCPPLLTKLKWQRCARVCRSSSHCAMRAQQAPVTLCEQSVVLPAQSVWIWVAQKPENSLAHERVVESVATMVAMREVPPSFAPVKKRDQ